MNTKFSATTTIGFTFFIIGVLLIGFTFLIDKEDNKKAYDGLLYSSITAMIIGFLIGVIGFMFHKKIFLS